MTDIEENSTETKRDQRLQSLVAAYQKDQSQETFKLILERMQPVMRGCIWFLTRNPYDLWFYYDVDELRSTMTLILWKDALPKYEPEKASFITYCRRTFLNRCLSIKRNLKAKKKIPRNITCRLTKDDEDIPDPSNWYQEMYEQNRYKDLVEDFSQDLSPFEQAVLFCYIKQKSYKVTSRYLKMKTGELITTKTVDNALTRIRRKAQEFKRRRIALGFIGLIKPRLKRSSHVRRGRTFPVSILRP